MIDPTAAAHLGDRYFENVVVLAKHEASYGVQEAFASGNALVVSQLNWTQVAGQDRTRDLVRGYMGAQERFGALEHVELSARIELTGSGDQGTAPPWAPLLLSAGFAETLSPAGSVMASPPRGIDTPTGSFTFAAATYTGTIDRTVRLTCTTAGGSGVAAFTVSAPAFLGVGAHNQAGVVMTNATPFALPNGTITPTIVGAFDEGDVFEIDVLAPRATYDLVSRAFSSISMEFNLDGLAFRFAGTRGNAAFNWQANQFPTVTLSWQGLLGTLQAADPPTPDWSAWQPCEMVNMANTPWFALNGRKLVLEQLQADLGNKLVVTDRPGAAYIDITGRDAAGSAQWETVGLGVINPRALHVARTKVPLEILHGTAPGKLIKFAAPRAQIGRPSDTNSNGKAMTTAPLFLLPSDAGNDELSITVF